MNMKHVSAKRVPAGRLSQLPALTISFLPHPGAVLRQPIDVHITTILLATPFGAYAASLAPPQHAAGRIISALTRVNP